MVERTELQHLDRQHTPGPKARPSDPEQCRADLLAWPCVVHRLVRQLLEQRS